MLRILMAFALMLPNFVFADTSEDLRKAIELAGKAHAIVRNKKDALDNSDLLKQIDKLISPPLETYARLKTDERDLLAQAFVLAAQSDSSYSLAAEHLLILRRFENQFSKSAEKLVVRQVLTRDQVDLFLNGIELGDAQL